MNFSEYPIIICGSGNSIPFYHTDDKVKNSFSLRTFISSNYSIGLNYFFKYSGIDTTFTSFVDSAFYKSNLEDLKSVPFIIGRFQQNLVDDCLENSILLPPCKFLSLEHGWDIKHKMCFQCGYKTDVTDHNKFCINHPRMFTYPLGIYGRYLSGIWAISLALMLGFKTIYLLGMDGCEIEGKTHFYADLVKGDKKFHGVGKAVKGTYNCSEYNNLARLNEERYGPIKELLEKDSSIKIFNVSPNSAINVFPKIDYKIFHEMIGIGTINQVEARTEIRNYILEKIS